MGLVARKNKTKNVLLVNVTLLVQCWRAYISNVMLRLHQINLSN